MPETEERDKEFNCSEETRVISCVRWVGGARTLETATLQRCNSAALSAKCDNLRFFKSTCALQEV